MPTINRENIGVLNDRIEVTVNKEDYNPGFEKSLKDYSKNTNLPGFRKGKVPRSLIKKMYGKELFPQHVLKSVEDGLNNYLREEKLSLFGQPILQENEDMPAVDMNDPKEYSFSFEIGLRPKVDIKDIKDKLSFEKYKVKPTKKEVDEEIEDMQKRAATFEAAETIENDDDLIGLSFQLTDDKGKAIEEEKKYEEQFRFSYFSKKLQEALKGKKVGDTAVLTLAEAFEDKELDWIKKNWKLERTDQVEGAYLITLEKIEKAIPRKLNKEFYEMVFPNAGITNKEDFHKKITEDYQSQWDHQARHLLEHEIFEKLVDGVEIELPTGFLKEQLRREGKKLKTDEEVEEQYPEFERQTRWGVITSSVIEAEDLDANPEEIKDFFRRQVMGYFQMPEITAETKQMVDQMTDRMMQNEEQIDQAYRSILTNKMFDWLIDNANIEEKEISTKKFKELMEEHNHEHHGHE